MTPVEDGNPVRKKAGIKILKEILTVTMKLFLEIYQVGISILFEE